MKITVSNTDYNLDKPLSIIKAKNLGNYHILIEFNNGVEKFVDFADFLSKSQHQSIKKYLNETLFGTFKIIDGNLNWNDYDMIFPIADLYDGKI
ncbi:MULTISPECIES: DUF2442 domain-containing protein [Flavobacterium]|jgi:hypothetical protein|uniref:DUF2442 domain-containing protein n=1 Tax=Flavobacterium nackdongense TaxID=2547394 RepID=A0A4P6YFZ5_9FLAO|nr:DUF2442 domain-containing protein [Flavobacterium nackdongense]QBN19844.1 DUF2442 domain-containing protein [Flavobacterium nackdongense]